MTDEAKRIAELHAVAENIVGSIFGADERVWPDGLCNAIDRALSKVATAARQDALREAGWRPIDDLARNGDEWLVWWPKLKLDNEDNLTDQIVGGSRFVTYFAGGSWGEPPELEANGAWFGDDFEFAPEPTLYAPLLPPPPSQAPAQRREGE